MRAANARVYDRIHGRDVCSTREVCDTALAPRHCNRGVRKVVGPAETLELREEYGQLYRRDLLLRFATAKLVAADVCASADTTLGLEVWGLMIWPWTHINLATPVEGFVMHWALTIRSHIDISYMCLNGIMRKPAEKFFR